MFGQSQLDVAYQPRKGRVRIMVEVVDPLMHRAKDKPAKVMVAFFRSVNLCNSRDLRPSLQLPKPTFPGARKEFCDGIVRHILKAKSKAVSERTNAHG